MDQARCPALVEQRGRAVAIEPLAAPVSKSNPAESAARTTDCPPAEIVDNASPRVSQIDQQPLSDRLISLWRAKATLFLLLVPVWTVCYFLPQALPLREPACLPLWMIDEAVPFHPWWIVPYMSMYLLLPIPPLLAITFDQLRRYVIGMMVMFGVAGVCFFLWPVAYPRQPVPDAAPFLYRLIASVDKPVNTIPSLHAGLTAYALFFGARLMREAPALHRRTVLAMGWLWALLILYGTMATKQHYFIDLPPGIVLAGLAHWIAWRGGHEA